MAKDKKHNYPGFFGWTYTKWYFWVIVILYFLWFALEFLLKGYIVETIGTLITVIVIVSFFFLFAYILARHNCKKLNHI